MLNRHPSWKGLVLSGLAVLSLGSARAQSIDIGSPQDLNQLIRDKLGLAQWTLQEVTPPEIPQDGGFDSYVMLGDRLVHLDLHPYTMRTSDFRIDEVDANGVRTPVYPVPAPCTYKGDARDPHTGEILGTVVASSDEGKLWTRVRFANDNGNVWALQPLSDVVTGDTSTTHVTYYSEDILPFPGSCGTDALPDLSNNKSKDRNAQTGGSSGSYDDAGDDQIVLAFECDWPYTQWAWANTGKKIQRTIRDAENLMLDVEQIYENDCGVTFVISYYSVRTSNANDPYSGNDAGQILGQFQSIWNAQFGGVDRTIAHILSGRTISGGVLGVAYLDVLCSSGSGYGFSWTNFTSNSVSRAGLTAHEVGHNCSAPHCDGAPDCRIMCSGLGGCTGNLTAFGSLAISRISSAAGSAGCVGTEGAPITVPVFDDFETGGSLDTDLWHYNNGGQVSTGGTNEPSGVQSMRLNTLGTNSYDADDVRTGEINMSSFSTATVSFYLEQVGMESGERTVLKRYNAGKNWKKLHEEISDGVTDTTYQFISVAVPSNGIHSRSKFRFQQLSCDETNDRAFIDDFSITASAFTVWGGLPASRNIDGSRTGNFRVFGAPPNTPVVFFASLEGLKKRPFDPSNGELDLLGEALRLGSTVSDSQGLVTLDLNVPANLPSLSFYVQAVFMTGDGYEKSQPVLVTITP